MLVVNNYLLRASKIRSFIPKTWSSSSSRVMVSVSTSSVPTAAGVGCPVMPEISSISLLPLQQNAIGKRKYLFWFSNEHANFIKPELESLFKMFGLDRTCLDESIAFGSLVILDLPNDYHAHQILSRSVLTHSCFEIWASGNSLMEMHHNFKSNLQLVKPYEKSRFRIRVDSYGKKISQPAKIDLIHTLDYIPFLGEIDLTNPECSLHLIQYYGIDSNNIPDSPYAVFAGRWVGDGQRGLISRISLKRRKFIGTTSMDPLLSLLMANLGLVAQDSIVLDPFVGTGSLLVAAALVGGYVFGTDIDFKMIHAKTKPTKAFTTKREDDESVQANLKQYGVDDRYLDVLVADAALPLWREELKFDVILTDPPYGVRESTERIGSQKLDCKVPEELLGVHYPQKVTYSLGDIYKDLMSYSGQRLRKGGRLVCWIPVSRPNYNAEHLPQNPCFKLVWNCEQVLTTNAARRLLVFEKISEPNEFTETLMDSGAEMYRIRADITERQSRKERKLISKAAFGKNSKSGQIVPS